MAQTPYQPPSSIDDANTSSSGQHGDQVYRALIFIGAMLGGFAGIFLYLSSSVILEVFVVPHLVAPESARLSYGQQAVLVMTPLAGLFGSGIGAGLVCTRSGNANAGGWTIIFVALLITGIVAAMWQSSAARYGRDVSEIVLYAPFLAAGVLAAALGLMCLVLGRSRSTGDAVCG